MTDFFLQDFLSEHKIDKIYQYYQYEDGVSLGRRIVKFGWIHADTLNLTKPIVISYPSSAKNIPPQFVEWAQKEGRTAVLAEDYAQYFQAMVGRTHDDFLEQWEDPEDPFSEMWTVGYRFGPINIEDYQPMDSNVMEDFLVKLAYLLRDGKKFIAFGRGFKMV